MTVQSNSSSGVHRSRHTLLRREHDLADEDEDYEPRLPLHKKIKIHGGTARETDDLSESDNAEDGTVWELEKKPSSSALESALPNVKIDEEAIEEYEASQGERIAQDTTQSAAADRLNSRKWIRGKSSIYVDAFDLALDTVLDEESNLFNETELELFRHWRDLNYETKFLYVRLFLRKTSAWHRTSGLGYHSDISDMESALLDLQQKRSLPKSESKDSDDLSEESLGELFSFAESSELITTLEEASSLLKLDELKVLAKDTKIEGKTKKDLVQKLRRLSKEQSSLHSLFQTSNNEVDDEAVESPETMSTLDKNRDTYFVERIMNETGPCVRLSIGPLRVFERVHLVFYRSTEWTEKSLTTIILARMSKRNFPEYIVSRSASVFGTRDLLLEFESSLRTQYRIDNILEFNGRPDEQDYEDILKVFDKVLPRWRSLVQEELEKENSIYHSGEGSYLRRLSPAWVYTRIIHKATYVLGRQKQHKREHEIMTELLAQKLFHHSRRGAWYQRKALIEEHYMPSIMSTDGRSLEGQKRFWKRIALKTCETGLQDPLVHLIHHYDLQKRISKLERSCNIPKREQHDFSHARLVAPEDVHVKGTRIFHDSTTPDQTTGPRGSKSIWLDPLENNAECSVEAMCLSHYRSQGWKGYHSEGGIMRTLFAYLFFDVLFLYIPNVFQTPFQTCPLDLHTDSFYPSRLSEINHRLVQIENGMAAELIKNIWDKHSERETCVVGLDWSFPLEDLLEIVNLFDGRALAAVCQVLAQEYGTRGGGMPDLFLWNLEEKMVKFSEVKSENDRLSDTQRLWIHVLTGAGVRVELCHAIARKAERQK